MNRLGRYEILGELGRGAMGVVYQARDPQLDRRVALKVMLPPPELDGTALQQRRERFQREGRAAAKLTHPNIVTLHDVGEDQGHAFLVMEYLEGQTLDQLLQARGSLPLDQVVTIAEQVAHALDYAHRSSIVHRDVKPANIFLTSDGVVKVTDFGIARLTGETFTRVGQAIGTPSYMSPEQVAGLKVDGRSDLFSLGAVLYELITGDKAFPGDTLSTINYRILNEDPVPLRRLNPAYPAALDSCLKKALAKDPARRYARTTDLARDLRAAVEDVQTPADAPAAAPATATMADTPATQVRPAPSAPPPHRPSWSWVAVGGVAVAGLALAATLWLRPPSPPSASLPAPPPGAPARVSDDQATKAKAAEEEAKRKAEADRQAAEQKKAAEEADRKKATGDEAARKAVEAKAAEDRKRQEEAVARQQAEEAAKAKAAAEQLAGERKRLEEEKARLAQQQAALEADRKKAADEAARQKAATDDAARKAAEAKAAEDRKRQEEAETRRKAEEETRRTPRAGTIQRRGQDNAEMAFIPAGTFTMGSSREEMTRAIDECKQAGTPEAQCKGWYEDEMPSSPVRLEAFYLDRFEVKNALLEKFVAATRHRTTAEQQGSGRGWVERGGKWQWDDVKGAAWRTPSGP
jgi:serine/threonine-protein kinase